MSIREDLAFFDDDLRTPAESVGFKPLSHCMSNKSFWHCIINVLFVTLQTRVADTRSAQRFKNCRRVHWNCSLSALCVAPSQRLCPCTTSFKVNEMESEYTIKYCLGQVNNERVGKERFHMMIPKIDPPDRFPKRCTVY